MTKEKYVKTFKKEKNAYLNRSVLKAFYLKFRIDLLY